MKKRHVPWLAGGEILAARVLLQGPSPARPSSGTASYRERIAYRLSGVQAL